MKLSNFPSFAKSFYESKRCAKATAEDVLNLVNGKVPLLIEIKSDRKVGETEKTLADKLRNYKGDFAIQSFNPFSVKWFRDNYPEIPRGQLSASFRKDKMFILKKLLLRNVFFNFMTKPDFVSYAIDNLPNKRVEEFRKNGGLILGWTVKKVADLDKIFKFCDSMIFENELVIEEWQAKQDFKKS